MIDIDEKKYPELYYDAYKGYSYCESIPDKQLDWYEVDYHTFWIGEFGRKQILPIKSFFATQTPNLARLNLWSTENLADNPLLAPYKDRIVFRHWNPVEEAKGTVLEGLKILTASDSQRWLDGDLLRLLVLHKYGGVYFDMDVVFLRDFAPLLNQEFMYKWSNQKEMINGAVMHLDKGSQLSLELLRELSKRNPIPNSTTWGCDTYMAVRRKNKNFTIFPSAFFDTEWQLSDEKEPPYQDLRQPFKNLEQSKLMFDRAFCWHWHSRWNEPIEEGSKWEKLEKLIKAKLQERFSVGV